MRNWKKKDRRVPRRTSVMSMTLSSYANQIRNLTGAAGQILRFLGQIDDTGEHIGSTDVRTAASAFSCPESDVEDALSMFKMAKEAEQKENKRDMSKTREGLTSNEKGDAEGRQVGTAADKGDSSNRKSCFWSFKYN
nr:uncharacterized protein LOC107412262 [Ziziphus jujuba var. spinosa]XP_048324770.1 uncharacterized protein LOC107412262 [Ziziphus jujuba var. spinosa]XP_048324771.1 uncharacterized protein LOC107412262 [Ziziphus jujuba var. spinosa]